MKKFLIIFLLMTGAAFADVTGAVAVCIRPAEPVNSDGEDGHSANSYVLEPVGVGKFTKKQEWATLAHWSGGMFC